MLLWKVEELLRDRGVPVERKDSAVGYLEVAVEQALITIESRPHYCDRGNFIVKVFPHGPFRLELDASDGFPRYYFGPLACAEELRAWMAVRKLLPGEVAP